APETGGPFSAETPGSLAPNLEIAAVAVLTMDDAQSSTTPHALFHARVVEKWATIPPPAALMVERSRDSGRLLAYNLILESPSTDRASHVPSGLRGGHPLAVRRRQPRPRRKG